VSDHGDVSKAAITSFVLALCDDPDCDPAAYRLCEPCSAVLDEAYPAKCGDPDCYPCTDRGAAEAARAEQ
jgi:hypothetical protein